MNVCPKDMGEQIVRFQNIVIYLYLKDLKNLASLNRLSGVSNGDTGSIFQASTHIIRVKIIDDRE